jgi:hypothetical protein
VKFLLKLIISYLCFFAIAALLGLGLSVGMGINIG